MSLVEVANQVSGPIAIAAAALLIGAYLASRRAVAPIRVQVAPPRRRSSRR